MRSVRSEFRVAGGHHAALAARAEVLARIEAEAAEVAEAAAAAALVLGAVGLRGVLDDDQAALPRDGEDRVHVGRLAVEVHRDDRLRARRDGGLELRRVHRVGARVNVHQPRARARVADGRDGGDERERHGDDLVARPDAGGEQRQVQRAGAGVDGDAVAGGAVGGELLLERGDFAARARTGSCRARGPARRRVPARMDWCCAFRSTSGITRQSSFWISTGRPCVLDGLGGGLEDADDAQAGAGVGERALAGLDAADEVLRLGGAAPPCRRAAAPTCRRCGSRCGRGRGSPCRRRRSRRGRRP